MKTKIIALIMLALGTAAGYGQTQWTVRKVDTTTWLRSVIWAGDQFIAVGYKDEWAGNNEGSAIFTSPDGITWTSRNSVGRGFSHIMQWANLLLAFGGNDISTSRDGLDWTVRYSADTSTIYINGIAGSDSMLVAVGGNYRMGGSGIMWISPDGITWTRHAYDTIPKPEISYYLNAVIWADDKFVAVGYAGCVYNSPDGNSWIRRTGGGADIPEFYDILCNGSLFVAIAYGGYSP
ncbi:MAG: hypothetical protein JW768_16680 [Chitinispirillaceae bacterium]|nr:hypothetical protein [Chitinispirillaceae bacterium]